MKKKEAAVKKKKVAMQKPQYVSYCLFFGNNPVAGMNLDVYAFVGLYFRCYVGMMMIA